jgi:hypothetical protein
MRRPDFKNNLALFSIVSKIFKISLQELTLQFLLNLSPQTMKTYKKVKSPVERKWGQENGARKKGESKNKIELAKEMDMC